MHRYALCSRVIGTTNISGLTSDTILAQRLFLGFSTLSPLSILTKGLLGVLRCIQPVTSQDCFGRAKMAANFGLD